MVTPQRNLDMNALRKAAHEGDSNAQYALAAALSQTGDKDEADRWLKASADKGNGEALYTLGTRAFYSSRTLDEGVALLKEASAAGSLAATRLLGAAFADGAAGAADWEKGVACVIDAACEGDPGAMTEIAMLLFARNPDDEDGASLIAHGAMKNAAAAAVAVRRAAGGRQYANTSLASKALQLLVSASYPNAPALKTALAARAAGETDAPQEPDWKRIAKKLSTAPAAPDIEVEQVCDRPYARVYREAVSIEECEYIIAVSTRLLAPSLIVDPQTGEARPDGYRNSLTAILSLMDLDLATVMLNQRIAGLVGLPAECSEFMSILCYKPGQQYRSHFDWLPPGPEFDRSGQRVATALVSLNDDYEGGETHFLSPDIRFKGAAGDLLIFDNVLADGKGDPDSRHAGLPVAAGTKWISSKWFREKKYNF